MLVKTSFRCDQTPKVGMAYAAYKCISLSLSRSSGWDVQGHADAMVLGCRVLLACFSVVLSLMAQYGSSGVRHHDHIPAVGRKRLKTEAPPPFEAASWELHRTLLLLPWWQSLVLWLLPAAKVAKKWNLYSQW